MKMNKKTLKIILLSLSSLLVIKNLVTTIVFFVATFPILFFGLSSIDTLPVNRLLIGWVINIAMALPFGLTMYWVSKRRLLSVTLWLIFGSLSSILSISIFVLLFLMRSK
jgi:hypothetical protein